MTQPAQPNAPAAAQPAAPASPAAPDPAELSLDGRAAAAAERLRAEKAAAAGSAGSAPGVAPGPETPEAAKARAEERKRRLSALTAQDRERVDYKTKLAAGDRAAQELERERRARQELEQRTKDLVDIGKLDEASFLKLAAEKGIDGKRLGAWIRDLAENPERVAAREAHRAIDPRISELEAQIKKQDDELRAWRAEQEQQRAQAEGAAVRKEWLGFVGQSDAAAPLAARFLKTHGEDEFLKVVNVAAARLPEAAGGQALLDAVEEFLDTEGRAYAQHLASLYGLTAADTSQGKLPPNRAAAQANTVSNTHAATRTSVVDEDEDFASLPLDERARRIAARFG